MNGAAAWRQFMRFSKANVTAEMSTNRTAKTPRPRIVRRAAHRTLILSIQKPKEELPARAKFDVGFLERAVVHFFRSFNAP
jgi:hypothetical protein